jgi:hypothetical protein
MWQQWLPHKAIAFQRRSRAQDVRHIAPAVTDRLFRHQSDIYRICTPVIGKVDPGYSITNRHGPAA